MQVTKHAGYTEKCDIFALGCLLYDLYTRQLRYVALFNHSAHANVLGQYAVRVRSHFMCPIWTVLGNSLESSFYNSCNLSIGLSIALNISAVSCRDMLSYHFESNLH